MLGDHQFVVTELVIAVLFVDIALVKEPEDVALLRSELKEDVRFAALPLYVAVSRRSSIGMTGTNWSRRTWRLNCTSISFTFPSAPMISLVVFMF